MKDEDKKSVFFYYLDLKRRSLKHLKEESLTLRAKKMEDLIKALDSFAYKTSARLEREPWSFPWLEVLELGTLGGEDEALLGLQVSSYIDFIADLMRDGLDFETLKLATLVKVMEEEEDLDNLEWW